MHHGYNCTLYNQNIFVVKIILFSTNLWFNDPTFGRDRDP